MRRTGLILLYHRIASPRVDPFRLAISPRQFAEHLNTIRTKMHPLPLAELVRRQQEGTLPPRAVALTLDDGYADVLLGLEALERYEVSATLFVVTGAIGGRTFWWDELSAAVLEPETLPHELRLNLEMVNYRWVSPSGRRVVHSDARMHLYGELWRLLLTMSETHRRATLDAVKVWASNGSHPRTDARTLTLSELQRAASHPLVEIGSHTVTHPVLASLSVDEEQKEIEDSRRDLEGILHKPVMSFSYPYGWPSSIRPSTKKLVKHAGYVCACTGRPGAVTTGADTDAFLLPRISVRAWNPRQFLDRMTRVLDARS